MPKCSAEGPYRRASRDACALLDGPSCPRRWPTPSRSAPRHKTLSQLSVAAKTRRLGQKIGPVSDFRVDGEVREAKVTICDLFHTIVTVRSFIQVKVRDRGRFVTSDCGFREGHKPNPIPDHQRL